MKKAFALVCLASALLGVAGTPAAGGGVVGAVGEESLVKRPVHPHPHPHPKPDQPSQPHHHRHHPDQPSHHRHHPDDEKRQAMVDHINSLETTWTAGLNKRFLGRPLDAIRRQLGVPQLKVPAHKRLPRKVHTGFDVAAIPTSFDARTQWPNCPTIQEIRDQSDCGSCWAFGAVEAASDRICIGTKGAVNAHLSAEDLLSCCSSCGDGCNGGDPGSAWQYLASTGVVTGGNYNDFSWCSSYSMPNCEHHNNHTTYPACGSTEYNTPSCPTACDPQSTYSVPFAKDAHIFASAYSIGSDPAQIQQEIMTNGPVEVAFQVYSDFEQYTGGVYQHVSGDFLGGHAVKMIGWGVTDDGNNTPYWIIANSWNNDWGENGFFRILRGSDECGIEDSVVAGIFQSSKAEAEVEKAVAAPATTKTNCESGIGVSNLGVGCTYWQCNNAGTGQPSAGCARDFQVHNAPCFSKCAGHKGHDEYFPCLARCEADDYWSEKCNLQCNQCYGACPVGDTQCETACLNAGMSPYPQVVPSSTAPF